MVPKATFNCFLAILILTLTVLLNHLKNRLIGCDVAGEYMFIRNVIISTFLIEKEQI